MNYNILTNMLDGLNKRVRALESNTVADKNSLRKKLEKANERIAELEERLGSLEERLNSDGK